MTEPLLTIAGEGALDLAVLRRLALSTGFVPGPEYMLGGKARLDVRLRGYNAAARIGPWLVLRDLDNDAACPGELAKQKMPEPNPYMIFRVTVRAVEAWLMGDRKGIAHQLGFPESAVPRLPEEIAKPKDILLQALTRSRTRAIAEMAVVRDRNGRLAIGPEYNAVLADFVATTWSLQQAADACPSLSRALRRCVELRARIG